MSELDALLRAVIVNPDEMTPRLVYADRLDEAGDRASRDRAAFIRADVEIHRNGVENLR